MEIREPRHGYRGIILDFDGRRYEVRQFVETGRIVSIYSWINGRSGRYGTTLGFWRPLPEGKLHQRITQYVNAELAAQRV